MAGRKESRNTYLEAASESDADGRSESDGYDSEAAEVQLRKTRGSRVHDVQDRAKKRKLNDAASDEEGSASDDDESNDLARSTATHDGEKRSSSKVAAEEVGTAAGGTHIPISKSSSTSSRVASKSQNAKVVKKTRPGIIYMPSLPPHLKPSALKNLLAQRGFAPVSRLFLTPGIKTPGSGKSSKSRKTYTEAWLEFSSHKTAKRCAESLNANQIGGPKRGYYHDDLWNMRYLRGMSWDDLMGSLREERREEEVRKGDERRRVRQETEQFLRGVEQAKVQKTMSDRAKKRKGDPAEDEATSGGTAGPDGPAQSQFHWKQFEVKDRNSTKGPRETIQNGDGIDGETKKVLGLIF